MLGTLNMEFRAGNPPAEVLKRINRLLCEKSPPSSLSRPFCSSSARMAHGQFIGTGHVAARVFCTAAGKMERLVSGQSMLGLFDFAVYETRAFQLCKGTSWLSISDGVTEYGQNPAAPAWRRWYYWAGCRSPEGSYA
jgi:serine phosphatase RsbU (regulator of sigma subunit)